MARTKEIKNTDEEVAIEETAQVVVETETTESDAKKQFQLFIESYAKANPAKYELKKEALLVKLNTL